MKTLILASTLTLFIILIIALFIVSNLLVEYIKINEKIKDENWSLIQELKECENDERNPFDQRTFTPPKRENKNIINKTINWNYVR